jgi:hypothetical protein
MAYILGNTFKSDKYTKAVVVLNTGNPYVGFRAFARNEATDRYTEVLEYAQEQMWVDGTNEGAWSASTFETSKDAFEMAWKAHRHINKNQRVAA